MRNSKKTNIIASALTICGVLGTVLDIGNGVIFLIKSDYINITYNFFYIILASIGLAILLHDFMPRFAEKIKNSKIEPDTNIKEALDYVLEDSYFGKSLQKNKHGQNDAIKAIQSHLLSGKLKLFGTSKNHPLFHEIKKAEFNKDNLKFHYVEMGRHEDDIFIAYISESESDLNEKYKNLSVSKKQLKKYFPSKYEH